MKRSGAESFGGLVASWLLLAAMATLTLFDIIRGPWNVDSGWYLLRAAFVANGARPYLDYPSIYPPAMDLIHAIPIALGMDRYSITIAAPYLWNIANAAASAMLARRLGCSVSGSLVAAAGFLVLSIENEGNHVTLEHGVVFFSLVALLLLTRERSLSFGTLFWCGVAVALAVLSKQNGLVTLIPVGAALYERREQIGGKELGAWLAGLILPVVLLLAYLDFRFIDVYRETTEKLFGYAAVSDTPLIMRWELVRSAPTALFLATLPVVGLVGIVAGRRRVLMVAALAGAITELLPRFARSYPHYTLNMWPFALLVLLLAGSVPSRAVVRFARFAGIALMTGAILSFVLIPDRWLKKGDLPTLFRPAAAELQALTEKEEPIRVYSSEMIIPFLANRPMDEDLNPMRGADRTAILQIFDLRVEAMAAKLIATGDDELFASGDPMLESPAVVVEKDTPWASPLRHRLERAGFPVVFDERGTICRITVYDRPPRK